MAWTDKYVDLSVGDGNGDGGGNGDGSTGDPWTSLSAAKAGIEAVYGGATATAPTRLFVRGNQTLGAAHNFSTAGTAVYPIYWCGCTGTGETWTRIGNVNSGSRPTVTQGTYKITATGGYQVFEGLSLTSAVTSAGGTFDPSGALIQIVRCRIVNTAANAASRAIRIQGNHTIVNACYLQSTTTSTYVAEYSGSYGSIFGCVINGGINGCNPYNGCLCAHNLVFGNASRGIHQGLSSNGFVINNTVIGGNTTGITATGNGGLIANNIIKGTGSLGYPISFDANEFGSVCFNAWYNVTNDLIGGIVEAADDAGFTFGNSGLLGADPLPNSADSTAANAFDLSIAARADGFPGAFETAYSYVGVLDHGAVQTTPDFPAVGNVTEDDTVDGVTGTFAVPTEAQVEATVGYGAGGTEFEGTLDVPTAEEIAAAMWSDITSPDRTTTA